MEAAVRVLHDTASWFHGRTVSTHMCVKHLDVGELSAVLSEALAKDVTVSAAEGKDDAEKDEAEDNAVKESA